MVSYLDLHVQVIYKKNVPFDNVPSEHLDTLGSNASIRSDRTSRSARDDGRVPLGMMVLHYSVREARPTRASVPIPLERVGACHFKHRLKWQG